MNDTICAISTSPAIGAISIVRVSGPKAINIVNSVLDIDIRKSSSHTIKYAHVIDKKEIIDEVLVMIMLAPKTYTKEDIVEINCHGGKITTEKVLSLLLSKGCRLADPGEFTKRAFLNGRIDLTQAEAVNDLINAKTNASKTLALNQVNGFINKEINDLRNKMALLLSNIEVNIDYPEYVDEIQITEELLEKELKIIKDELTKIEKDSLNGRIISNGINIAIIGKPNVGKSSLLNIFLDEEKAIVTNIAGTTRDIVEGKTTLNGIALNFIDTAGIHKTNDVVEKIGVDKSLKALEMADLVILVINANEKITKEDKYLLEKTNPKNTIIFKNKSDLGNIVEIDKKYESVTGNTLSLDGIRDLKETIISKFDLDKIINNNMSYLSNIRQIDLVKKAKESIENAYKSLNNNVPTDIISIDITNAWNYLGEITGESYKDELVDTIFSNFCLGK